AIEPGRALSRPFSYLPGLAPAFCSPGVSGRSVARRTAIAPLALLKRPFYFEPDARPTGFPLRFLTQSYIHAPHLRQWRTLTRAPRPRAAAEHRTTVAA
ncbi:hypothetical protein, partial [Burkholderia contaminans]|uniref:hypothetical protein n=1 Tax=Burkholderia contaminans TaxID=488447 RepID=UPI001C9555F5